MSVRLFLSRCHREEYVFQVHSGCWQNSVPSSYRTEIPISSLSKKFMHMSQLLEATSIPWLMASVQSQQQQFKTLEQALSDFSFCCISLLLPSSASTKIISLFQGLLISNLNYICKSLHSNIQINTQLNNQGTETLGEHLQNSASLQVGRILLLPIKLLSIKFIKKM